MVFFGFASIGYVLSTEPLHLFIGRFLQGFGAGMVLPISMAYVGDIAPKGREGTYTGVMSVARTMGWGCGPLIGGGLMDLFGINVPFLVMGGLALASCVLILLTLPETQQDYVRRSEVSFRTILEDKTLRGLVIYRAINAVGTGNLFSFFPLFADSLGIAPTQVGILLSSRMVVMSLMQGPFGVLVDRYDKIKLVLLSGIGSAILLLLVPLSTNFLEMLSLGLLLGCDWALLLPATTALAAEFGREYGMASVMSTVDTGFSVGLIVGPLLSGVIMDVFDLHAVFYFGGLIAVSGIVFFYYITKSRIH
jgi:MFS family permease